MAERVGLVSDIQAPPEGTKRPWSAKIGNRKVKFWGTEYESQDPSAVLVVLRDAENRGATVRVEGDEQSLTGPKGSYTSFTAKSAEIVEGVSAASAPAQTFHPGAHDGNKDRSITAQVAAKIAGSWVASGAIEANAFSSMAGYVFYAIQELIEGKATGNDESKEWATP